MEATKKYSRSSGVLLPLTMLHGPFGIGVMGEEAVEFIDFLNKGGFRAWQVLPLESTGGCFSPYKCISAFAGEPMLIDPRMLHEMGLVTQDELSERMSGVFEDCVEYPLVRKRQWEVLRKAYSRSEGNAHSGFKEPWLDNYALYMALKHRYGGAAWFDWPDRDLRRCDAAAVKKAESELKDEIEFYKFVQWIFAKQWSKLRAYAAAKGVTIIGDMPIYVSEDSVEVWSRRELFDADENGNFAAVGGCPPDYFNPEGQLWGNPIYNWKLMKAENYAWWTGRMQSAAGRYDVVRLDHFRGFESYWRVQANAKSARDGKWVKGPGMALIKAMTDAIGPLPVIAEDLGTIDEKVEALLMKTNYRGMKVLQFAHGGDDTHLPHNYTQYTVAFTGTHDNTTLLAWHFGLDQEAREWALAYVGFEGDWTQGGPNCEINKAWIRALYASGASLVIVPIQDLLGYGADTRTNVPGTPDGNWRFRIHSGALSEIDAGFYAGLSRTFFRDNDPCAILG
ncbi:MAG: 4-alpha-glucanotransferase [Oscillospiraceae bacterium]|nr:4-alpha-glucanotransferase [Oscillospiraceae bacterium]